MNEKPAPGRILRSESLVKRYRKRAVVNEVSVEVRQGRSWGCWGRTARKDHHLLHDHRNDQARFREGLSGRRGDYRMPMYRRARQGWGTFPGSFGFRKMTVEENILSVLQMMDLSNDERRRRTTSS